MTNTNLKAQIDSHITNKTQLSSISHTAVGNDLKAIVDYVDQENTVGQVIDATTTIKGKLKLSGDLSGTADVPTVPGLILKENSANKSINVSTDATSDDKYPSVKAVKDYADSLVVGLIDDRGNYTPGGSSPGAYPSTGGSGVAGVIKKGDLWYIATSGFLGTTSVAIGASVRALIDNPGNTAVNWSILNAGLGYTPENQANRDIDVNLTANSDTKYPSQKAIKAYVDLKTTLANLTSGTVNGNTFSTSLYTAAILTYGINNVYQTVDPANDTVVLPESNIKIGQSIYVFCFQNIKIKGTVANSAVIRVALETKVSIFNAVAGDSFRFTKVNSSDWAYEKIQTINKSTDVTLISNSDNNIPTEKAVKTYVDANAGNVDLTSGTITAASGNTAIITNGVTLVTSNVSELHKVILPETGIKVGQSIYLRFNGDATVQGNLGFDPVIFINSLYKVRSLVFKQSDFIRFTKLSSISWGYDRIESIPLSQQISATEDGYPESMPAINGIKYIRLFTNDLGNAIKLTGSPSVGDEYYIKNPTDYRITLRSDENINGNSSLYLEPGTYWYLVKEDSGTNSITAFQLSTKAKEDVLNKSIDLVADGASDIKYPSVKAVKTYVDANSGIPAKTKGNLSGSNLVYLSYTDLIYDINLLEDGSESSFFKLPNVFSAIGKEVIVDVRGSNCRIYGFVPGDLSFETNVNGSSGQIVTAPNDLIKFTAIGVNFWLVEYLQRETPILPSTQAIKTVKTTINSDQILQLFTTPVTILSSTTTGIAKIPLNILIKRNGSGTNYTIESNQFSLLSNNNSSYTISLSNSILTSSLPVSYVNFSANANSQIATSLDTEVYKLGAYTSNPTGGTGGISVYVTYMEITL